MKINQHALFVKSDSIKTPTWKKYVVQKSKATIQDIKLIYSSPLRMGKKELVVLTSIATTGGLLYWQDQDLHQRIHNLRNYSFYSELNKLGDNLEPLGLYSTVGYYYYGGFVLGSLFGIEPLREASFDLVETFFLATFIRGFISHTTKRARPYFNLGPHKWGVKNSYSFPSGHTSTIFQFAVICSHHFKSKFVSTALYSIAGLVAYQRIDADEHWPSDVFIGAVYGTALAKAILRLHAARKTQVAPLIKTNRAGTQLGIQLHF